MKTFTIDEKNKFINRIINPTKIIAVGLNYHDHAQEMKKKPPKEPMIFLKSPSSLTGPYNEIFLPNHMSSKIDYEGELGIIISKEAKWVSVEKSHKFILGAICINDVTARDLQAIDIQFGRGKNFDTFCPVGTTISDEIDYQNVKIQTLVNGEIKQDSNTNLMVHKIDFLISFISKIMTLNKGDIILTGTPGGVGQILENDLVSVKIDGLGQTKNKVVNSF
ncbi:MAG: fumarylacetoacetate hydrolase family protein [Thermodesulfobacteriota bacterium]|jgi:2-keto-4-pentenoate hydratase/2-oxohepta-3-ene-1,7-dioic acid hydratase in catechol pathway|nr:fumarylacetoacetate hydrolase family protein [Candidatus Dadabacteria bacterium]|tara:strand:- start:5024 stop:5686 length:663 start_codon:yes stop_codon:yes gene_type:complete